MQAQAQMTTSPRSVCNPAATDEWRLSWNIPDPKHVTENKTHFYIKKSLVEYLPKTEYDLEIEEAEKECLDIPIFRVAHDPNVYLRARECIQNTNIPYSLLYVMMGHMYNVYYCIETIGKIEYHFVVALQNMTCEAHYFEIIETINHTKSAAKR